MSKKTKIFKDMKRSLGLLLSLTMASSCVAPMTVGASETLKIVDTGKMFGVGYATEALNDGDDNVYPFVFQSCEAVVIENSGDVDMTLDPVLDATVYVTVDGDKYEVMQLSTDAAYLDSYMTMITAHDSGEGYIATMAPKYFDADGNEIDDGVYSYCTMYGSQYMRYCYDALNYGFSEEIISYLEGQGITEWDKIIEWFTAKERYRTYTVEYTLTDSNNAYAEYEQTGASLYDFEVDAYEPPSIYAFGKRIRYDRIEDLSEYHENNEYNGIKMYKGNIYVDADSMTGDTLSIPNINNTGFFELNSVYVNDAVLYNDGYTANNIVKGYNLLDVVFTMPVDTEDEAVDEFLDLMTGKYYTEDDFSSIIAYNDYWSAYYEINNANGHSYMLGDELITINTYNDYEYIEDYDAPNNMFIIRSEEAAFVEAYNSGDYDDTFFMWQSSVLPEIPVSEWDADKADALIGYFNFLRNGFSSWENVYNVMVGDEIAVQINLYDIEQLLYNIAMCMEDEACTSISELSDYCTYWDYENERDILLNTITGITPVKNTIESEWVYLWLFEDINDTNDYCYEASEIEELLDTIGLASDDLKIWLVNEKIEKPYDSNQEQYVETLIDTLTEELGAEGYAAFREYIADEFVTYGSYLVSVAEEDSSQKKTDIDVYEDELEIPLSYFDVTKLGEENVISRFWYAGNEQYYLIPVEGNSLDEQFLYHGEYAYVTYMMSQVKDYSTGDINFGNVYSLKYDSMWKNELGTVIFAKAPDRIEAQSEKFSTADEYELTWDVPNDNGAEILGYQIAVVLQTEGGSAEPTDDMYITVGDEAGSYSDLGDNYTIKWSTEKNSYMVQTNGASVDVYVRAVNVIGAAKSQKFSITNPTSISITGPSSVKVGNTGNYDTIDNNDVNVETSCTYSIDNSPAGVSISADGTLTVDSSCTVSSITITVTGKTGTDYEGYTDSMTVTIEGSSDNNGANPDDDPDINPDDPEINPDDNPNPNPDAGVSVSVYAVMLTMAAVIALAVAATVKRKKNFES